ncbi:MAG: MMPL family transporter [Deltaproteobacteria bacterium]|nr:MMPL family transporter [Deltaproteobacteria bacterium]
MFARLTLPRWGRLVASTTAWCLRRKGTALTILGVLTLLAGVALSRVEIDSSPEIFVRGSADWLEYQRVNETYGIGEALIVAFVEREQTVFDPDTIGAVRELDHRLRAIDGVKRVLSIATATVLGDSGSVDRTPDTVDVGPLLPVGPVTPDSARLLAERITGHPIYWRLLAGRRTDQTLLFVQLDPLRADPRRRLEIAREVRSIADEYQTEQRSVHLAGASVTKEAVASGVRRDILTFLPAAFVLLFVLLWLMFGDVTSGVVPLVAVGTASLLLLAGTSVLGVELNMATAVVPTIILVVGLADSVHLLCEVRRQYARIKDAGRALVQAVEVVAWPCLITSATAAFGFAALAYSSILPLRELGVMAALGLLAAYGLTMTIVPLLLFILGHPRGEPRPFDSADQLAEVLGKIADAASRRLGLTLGALGLLTGASIAVVNQLEVNSNIINYFGKTHRLRNDRLVIDQALGGANSIEIILASKSQGGFLDPDRLRRADRLARVLRDEHDLAGVFGFTDYLRFANRTLSGPGATPDDLPASREAVAQLMLISPEGFESLATEDASEVRLMVAVPALSSEATLRFGDQLTKIVRAELAGSDIEATVTGLPMMFARVVHGLIGDSIGSFGLAALGVWIALMIGLRSVGLGTLAMVPNLIPISLTFATMSLTGLSLDTHSAFIACIGAGVAVDDTIHIISRYQRARQHGAPNAHKALVYALAQAGHPVVLNSVLIAVGFSVLCLSTFLPTVQIGLLLVVLVAFALAFDLLVLPVLIIALDRVKSAFEPEIASGSLGHYLSEPNPPPPSPNPPSRQDEILRISTREVEAALVAPIALPASFERTPIERPRTI